MEFEKELTVYSKGLYTKALKYCKNEADALDLLQNTYVRALRYKHQFKPGTNLRAWLYTIMHNTFINTYRRNKRKSEILESEKHFLQSQDEVFTDETIISQSVFEALLVALEDALAKPFFDTLVLCDLKDKSYKEAAEILDVPVGTVMSRLFRARRNSRKFLLKNYDREFLVEFIREMKLEEVWNKEVAA